MKREYSFSDFVLATIALIPSLICICLGSIFAVVYCALKQGFDKGVEWYG